MVLAPALVVAAAAAAFTAVPPLPARSAHSGAAARSIAPVSFEQVEELDPGEVAGLRVLKYPHPLLRAANSDVEKFDYDLKQLTKRMFKLMYASSGVGLAAPQVGINQRLMVVNWEGDPGRSKSELVLCNPRIVERSDQTEIEMEGCLSFPGFTADVARADAIVVEFLTVKGKPRRLELSGWEARVFQHEYDHLDGKLYATDRLSEEERARVQPELERLVGRYDELTVGAPAAL
jgi:peptide deformylase